MSSAVESISWDKPTQSIVVVPVGGKSAYAYPAKSHEYATFHRVKSLGAYWNRKFVRTNRPFEKIPLYEQAPIRTGEGLSAEQKVLSQSFNVMTGLVLL